MLRGVDLEVDAGSIVALLGSNGAGKTTLVRVLSTLLRPDGGTARVLGHNVVADAHRVRESGEAGPGSSGSRPDGRRPVRA